MKQRTRRAWVAVFCCAAVRLAGGTEATHTPSPSSTTQSISGIASATAEIAAATPVEPHILAIQEELNRLRGGDSAETLASNEGEGLEGPLSTSTLLRTFGGLAVVVLLLLVCAALARRFLGPRLGLPGEEMRLVTSMSLSAKSKVHIIDVSGQRYLVGEGAGQLSLIAPLGEAEIESPPDDGGEDGPPPGGSFVSRFQAWQQQTGKQGSSAEVRASLLLIDGLCRRLRGKKPALESAQTPPQGGQ